MVSLADVRRWDAAGLETAFRAVGTVRDRILDSEPDLATARPSEQVWHGDAADRARFAHTVIAERLRRVASATTAVRVALAEAADAVAAIPAELRRADELAARGGFTIGADGSVTDARPPVVPADQVDAVRRQRTAAQAEIGDIVQRALTRAEQIDRTLHDVLTRAVAEQIDDGDGAGLVGAAVTATGAPTALPPLNATPAQIAQWWSHLSEAERESLLVGRPDVVGSLDGVPAVVRDEANRGRIPDLIRHVDDELTESERRWYISIGQVPGAASVPSGEPTPGETGEQRSLRERVEQLREQRGALDVITQATAPPNRQLLAVDIDGHVAPRAVVAVGNVDTARHVAVFTPGLTTTVNASLAGYVDDMNDLQTNARRQLVNENRQDEGVATVAWLGYDAPQMDTMTEADRSVLLARSAEHGGTDLAKFYDGINAARPDDPHVTALGHSYGSTTTGYALQQTTSPVDDAVLFGSPGAGTDSVSDLHVPSGHTAVIEARGDPVADLGRFGTDTNQLTDVVPLASHETLGADGRLLHESYGHSDYLTPGTTSQQNIAATIAGLPQNRVTGSDNGIGDYLRDGM